MEFDSNNLFQMEVKHDKCRERIQITIDSQLFYINGSIDFLLEVANKTPRTLCNIKWVL